MEENKVSDEELGGQASICRLSLKLSGLVDIILPLLAYMFPIFKALYINAIQP
jgi:hypothetical protein